MLSRFKFLLLTIVCIILASSPLYSNNFAAPNGNPYAGDGSCSNAANPCNLRGAVEDATDAGASGTTVFVRLNSTGATTIFEEDLIGAARVNQDMSLSTYIGNGPDATGVNGTIEVRGHIQISAADELKIVQDVELHLNGNPGILELRDNAEVEGPGVLVLKGGFDRIQLGDTNAAALPKVGTIENLRIEKNSGTVRIVDQRVNDSIISNLFIVNALIVNSGTFDTHDNSLWMVGPTNDGLNGQVTIGSTGIITGSAAFYLALDPAALGGPPNNPTNAFLVTGNGSLMMPFDKITDAGVRIELSETGSFGPSYARTGALYITNAKVHNGDLVVSNDSRVELDQLEMLLGSLHITGPGGEVFPGDGICDSGDESGVYSFSAFEIDGDLILDNTDDPTTVGCVEGLSLLAVEPTLRLKTASAASTIKGSIMSASTTGINLHTQNALSHNLAVQGDLLLASSPIFAFDSAAETGHQCTGTGNKLIFSGNQSTQTIFNTANLSIPSIEVNKASGSVAIDNSSSNLTVSKTLEIVKGSFIANGKLAGGSVAATNVADNDSDTLLNTCDNCPDNANLDQADQDNDGTGDACDQCPSDKNKTAPGTCGCGVADSDSDSDGTLDCNDGCPNDSTKTTAGVCGCGSPDADSNSNGVVDCLHTSELKEFVARAKTLVTGLKTKKPKKKNKLRATTKSDLLSLMDSIANYVTQQISNINVTSADANLNTLVKKAQKKVKQAAKRSTKKRKKRAIKALNKLETTLT